MLSAPQAPSKRACAGSQCRMETRAAFFPRTSGTERSIAICPSSTSPSPEKLSAIRSDWHSATRLHSVAPIPRLSSEENNMDFPDIRSLLPHTGRMVLLDRVIAADADNLCAEVTIRRDSVFFDGSGVGAWVGIEYMAQTIGAYAGY